MDLESNRFYQMGKRARSQGCPRTIDDGRLAPASREAWQAGWDWQDAWMDRPAETDEERAARKAEVRDACADLIEQLGGG